MGAFGSYAGDGVCEGAPGAPGAGGAGGCAASASLEAGGGWPDDRGGSE